MPMAPQAPQGAPQDRPEGPQDPQAGQAGGGSQLVADINSKLMQLLDLMQKAKLPPEDAQMLQQIIGAYQKFVDHLSGDSQEEAQESDQGAVPMEAGANPNAKPV